MHFQLLVTENYPNEFMNIFHCSNKKTHQEILEAIQKCTQLKIIPRKCYV